jgi:predicted permease
MAEASRNEGSWNYEVFGRLKQGVTFGQSDALLNSRSIESTARKGAVLTYAAALTPLHTRFVGDVTLMLMVFLSAVSAVLLIACVNVMNLMLTRATHREHEHVVRGALGARRSRLMQQLLTESLIVCAVGTFIGLLLAFALTDWLVVLSPESIPRREQIGVDGGALLFTLFLALVVGLGVGIAPALRVSKADLACGLNVSSLGSSGGVRRTRLRDAFVVAQLALALTLLVCGGVLIRSFAALMDLESGVDPRNVLVFDTSLPESKYQTFEDRQQFYNEMRSRLRAVSGVQTASLAVYFPASGWFHTVGFEVEGYSVDEREEIVAEEKQVTPDYFQTLGISAIEGRLFNEGDGETGPEVLLVSESLAMKYWPNGSAVGGRIRMDDEWRSVVGVVNDVKYRGDQRNFPQLYRPYAAGSFEWSMDGLIRVEGNPSRYVASVRRTIAAMDPEVVVSDLRPLEHFLWDAVSEPRFRALLLGCFGLVAVLLSVVGVYGVMAYAVAQRTREFGIRKALGADQFRTLREVAVRGLGLTLLGVCLGSLGAYAAVGVLQSYLFNVQPRDPLTFLLAVGSLAFASMLACGIPAFRAARVDPLVALRVS